MISFFTQKFDAGSVALANNGWSGQRWDAAAVVGWVQPCAITHTHNFYSHWCVDAPQQDLCCRAQRTADNC